MVACNSSSDQTMLCFPGETTEPCLQGPSLLFNIIYRILCCVQVPSWSNAEDKVQFLQSLLSCWGRQIVNK
jgi:hypothetical protein